MKEQAAMEPKNREIKFRMWVFSHAAFYEDGFSIAMDGTAWYDSNESEYSFGEGDYALQQYTGFKDKSGNAFIYEGDIVSLEGKLIGNQYENPELLEGETNLIVAGMGTKAWRNTEQEACKRGCYYAQ